MGHEATWLRRTRRITGWASIALLLVLAYLTWFVAPDWVYDPNVSAPLTRKILFWHPASAWASFTAYFVVFVASVLYLNERTLRFDTAGRAAAEVGFMFNTVALLTGTFWGMQEWARSGQSSLATVYSEPKVMVVVVMWLAFAAYLLLRRFVDGDDRRARLAAVFGVLGFIGVPLSFATSRILATSLHPDVAGPGANPDAELGATVGAILGFSMLVFLVLFIHLFLLRLQQLRLQERLETLDHDL